jgi:hypothetical protein
MADDNDLDAENLLADAVDGDQDGAATGEHGAVDGLEGDAGVDGLDDGSDGPGADSDEGRSEAAKLRGRLRDTEGQLAAMAARVAALQRAEVERLAAEHLATPADLWLTDTKVDTLLDDAGNVDSAKVAIAAKGVVASRPHWAATTARPIPRKPREALKGGGFSTDPDDVETGGSSVMENLLRNRN